MAVFGGWTSWRWEAGAKDEAAPKCLEGLAAPRVGGGIPSCIQAAGVLSPRLLLGH